MLSESRAITIHVSKARQTGGEVFGVLSERNTKTKFGMLLSVRGRNGAGKTPREDTFPSKLQDYMSQGLIRRAACMCVRV